MRQRGGPRIGGTKEMLNVVEEVSEEERLKEAGGGKRDGKKWGKS